MVLFEVVSKACPMSHTSIKAIDAWLIGWHTVNQLACPITRVDLSGWLDGTRLTDWLVQSRGWVCDHDRVNKKMEKPENTTHTWKSYSVLLYANGRFNYINNDAAEVRREEGRRGASRSGLGRVGRGGGATAVFYSNTSTINMSFLYAVFYHLLRIIVVSWAGHRAFLL